MLADLAPYPGWRNWQTRMVEGHVPEREWRFKPSPGHSKGWLAELADALGNCPGVTPRA
jgi:hypothetical protein